MIPTSRLPSTGERLGAYVDVDANDESTVSDLPATHASVLYQLLMDSLDQKDQDAVLDAIARHNREVRAAEASGVKVSEALR